MKDTDIAELLGEIDEILAEHGFGSQNLKPSEREAFKAQIGRLVAKRPPSPRYLRQRARHLRLPGEIIEVLKKEGPLTSSALAERLREDPRYMVLICEQLEEEGWLVRGKKAAKRLFFTPLTGEVVHGNNYDRLQRLLRELREIVDRHGLKPSLTAALETFFVSLLARPKLEPYHKQIARFRDEMLEAARNAESRSDVRGMIGLRPFFRQVVTWKLSAKAVRESRKE